MDHTEIIGGLMQYVLTSANITSHERVLVRRYPEDTACRIVERLLQSSKNVTVGLPEDDGTTREIQLPAIILQNRLEILPFVVAETPRVDTPAWLGSRGFASRLRTSFPLLAKDGMSRVLVLYDAHPVETQETTMSAQLGETIDSVDSLIAWLRTANWQQGFVPEVYQFASRILAWWGQRLCSDEPWNVATHATQLERAVGFLQSCQPCRTVSEVGEKLPALGLIFRDPKLVPTGPVEARLEENSKVATELENIRKRKVRDPVIEADRVLDIGPVGTEFHTSISAAFRSLSGLITDAGVNFGEVEARLRKNARQPAAIDLSRCTFTAFGTDGTPTGAAQPWRLLKGNVSEPNDTFEILVACPADKLRLVAPIRGDLRAYLYKDGKFVAYSSDGDGALSPGGEISLEIQKPKDFSVVELLVREQKANSGRPPRPTQIIRIGVFAGAELAVPEGAALDVATQAVVVDGSLDSIKVQVGSIEVEVEDVPPPDGSPATVALNGTTIRWVGEDRSPPEEAPVPHREIRLVELVGIRQLGDPNSARPFFAEGGRLSAACMTSAALDVDASWMAEEADLLARPEMFVGLTQDNEAALHEISRLAPVPAAQWMDARRKLFASIRAQCSRRMSGAKSPLSSVYLADFRDADVSVLAAQYVDAYCALLELAAEAARDVANRALIEPLLLCDRASTSDSSLRLAPTHPVSVALLAAVQRGLLSKTWENEDDRVGIEELLRRPLLAGVLPWVPWRGDVLTSATSAPLLWRCYGKEGAAVDTSDELAPVITQKIKRFLSLSPYLNAAGQRLYVNVEVGRGSGRYLLNAIRQLERDESIGCSFDVGIVSSNSDTVADLIAVFDPGRKHEADIRRERLSGFVRVCRLKSVNDRQAHLVFRMEAASSEKHPFSSLAETHPVVRPTGFAAGLSYEPARFAAASQNEVIYTRYVFSAPEALAPAAHTSEDVWGGPWRRKYKQLCRLTQKAAVGLHSGIGNATIPCESLRQIAGKTSAADYAQSFITVHCDPAQGPEFFVGPRTVRSGVFLVECSDRGSPELPGRDIVSVTSRIAPFRAALTAAVSSLPAPLKASVNDEVAKGLLRDINMLRGTEVFDFFREVARLGNHIYIMDSLDNVMALRFLLSSKAALPGYLPVVISVNDLTSRCAALRELRRGTKCDDIVVVYLPKATASTPLLLYRFVEVKFGPRNQAWDKAERQLSETSQKFAERVPSGIWSASPSPATLLLVRDIAWAIHEGIERYRAFGLFQNDAEMEERWGLKALMQSLHSGEFELRPYAGGGAVGPLYGSGLMLDPEIPGNEIEVAVEHAIEYITVPRGQIQWLLTTPVESIGSLVPVVEQRKVAEATTSLRPFPTDGRPRENEPIAVVSSPSPDVKIDTAVHGPSGSNTEKKSSESPGAPASSGTQDVQRQRAIDHVDKVFSGFVGNDGPVARLKRTLVIARLEGKASIEPLGLFGPKSTGKTELARRIATVLSIPKVELSETILRSAEDLAQKIREVADSAKLPLRMEHVGTSGAILRAPPMVVFIDEVHLLRKAVQDSLLKALEPADRTLLSTLGTINTREITFIIATTDPGALGDAFKSRVSRYELREYTIDEVVEILRAHRELPDTPPDAKRLDDEALRTIARVGRLVPRQALQLLREVSRELAHGFVDPDPETLRKHFWDNQQVDDMGLNDRDRAYLKALFPDKTMGVDALAAQLGQGKGNLSTDIEPYLLRLGLINRARDGRSLTLAGRELVPNLAK